MIAYPERFTPGQMLLLEKVEQFFVGAGIENADAEMVDGSPEEIRLSSKDSFAFEYNWRKETPEREAQIQVCSLVLPTNARSRGISGKLIRLLLDFCADHGDMSLVITGVVSRRWAEGLQKHGAVCYEERGAEWSFYIDPRKWTA